MGSFGRAPSLPSAVVGFVRESAQLTKRWGSGRRWVRSGERPACPNPPIEPRPSRWVRSEKRLDCPNRPIGRGHEPDGRGTIPESPPKRESSGGRKAEDDVAGWLPRSSDGPTDSSPRSAVPPVPGCRGTSPRPPPGEVGYDRARRSALSTTRTADPRHDLSRSSRSPGAGPRPKRARPRRIWRIRGLGGLPRLRSRSGTSGRSSACIPASPA